MKVSRTVLKTSLYWKLYRLSLTGIDIRTAQPDAVIDSLAQLPQLIEKGDINRCA